MNNPFNEFMLNKLLNNRRIDPITKCWNYTGSTSHTYYGQTSYLGKNYRIHRVAAYLCLGFDLNSELFICHKCDNRSCFNPLHLFIGDNFDNQRDRVNKRRNEEALRTHCPQGHEYNEENTYKFRNKRQCRTCSLANSKRQWEEKKKLNLERKLNHV